MGREKNREEGSMSTRSRPQYHYFYGATDSAADSVAESHEQEQESLIGEVLVSTDNEEETPTNSAQDFQHLLITNGDSSKWLFGPSPQDRRNSIGLGRTVLLILLVAAMSLLFAFILLPKTPTTRIPAAQTVLIPFEQVNRGEYGDPVEGFIDMDLFHPTLLSDSEPRSFQFPFPTGAFWTNLIVPSPEDGASYPIVVYPYAYKWTESSLQLSYPFGHRVVDKHSVVDNFEQDLTIYTLENISHRHVTKFDPLSVTLRFVATVDSKWETSLVQGSPYSTMKYLNATPVFRAMTTFKSVQCPGDDDENFSDLLDDDEGGKQRSLFGVCSVKVRSCWSALSSHIDDCIQSFESDTFTGE